MRVLIVSPHFPPVNTPDMHRVRMSLPYFREFGWEPYVLAVAPPAEATLDPLLLQTIPDAVEIERVPAVPLALSKRLGIGNIALRALPFLYTRGSALIADRRIDLVYFSTTNFLSMPLGRVWRRKFGVPYVVDIQDPWHSDYYQQHPDSAPPPKYSLARRLHAILEPWTMKEVGAVIAVSDDYVSTLRQRYSWLAEEMCTTLPFAASARDFELLAENPQRNRGFEREGGIVHGAYIGRGGDDMKKALDILFAALGKGIATMPALFGSVRLHFVGTDYAADARAKKTVEPVAREAGVGSSVTESTTRVSYFEALQILKDADFLVLTGSDDPAYTASKVYPYLMSGKPVVAVVHERSGLVPVLREAGSAVVVTFSEGRETAAAEKLLAEWRAMLEARGEPTSVDQTLLARYSAREMTRRQSAVFDSVLARERARAA